MDTTGQSFFYFFFCKTEAHSTQATVEKHACESVATVFVCLSNSPPPKHEGWWGRGRDLTAIHSWMWWLLLHMDLPWNAIKITRITILYQCNFHFNFARFGFLSSMKRSSHQLLKTPLILLPRFFAAVTAVQITDFVSHTHAPIHLIVKRLAQLWWPFIFISAVWNSRNLVRKCNQDRTKQYNTNLFTWFYSFLQSLFINIIVEIRWEKQKRWTEGGPANAPALTRAGDEERQSERRSGISSARTGGESDSSGSLWCQGSNQWGLWSLRLCQSWFEHQRQEATAQPENKQTKQLVVRKAAFLDNPSASI